MKKKLMILIIIFLAICIGAGAQENGDEVSIGKFYKLDSKTLGETRTILVSLPEGYQEGNQSYPVIYILYADQIREYFAEAVAVVNRLAGSGDIPPMIIVGIVNRDRYGDLLPVSAREGKEAGAGNFLAFMENELNPWLQKNYRVGDFNLIMGPQAGAPFAVYALINGDKTFNAAIINNPFWPMRSSEKIKNSLRGVFTSNTSFKKYIHITYKDDYWGNKKLKKYVHNMEREYSQATVKDFRIDVNFLEGNDDFVVPTGLKAGLKKLYKGYRLENFSGMESLQDIEAYFQRLSDKVGAKLEVPYLTLVFFGDHLIKEKKQEQGEEVYHYIIKTFPASVDGLYRMAEIYRKRGEKEKALDFYRKCVERMEDMAPAREWVKKLEAESEK